MRQQTTERRQRVPRPFGIPVFELLVVGLLAALFMPWGRPLDRWQGEPQQESRPSIAFAVLGDSPAEELTHTAEIIAFDEQTGALQAWLPTGDQTQVLPDPHGEWLYYTDTLWQTPDQGITYISKVSTRTWQREALYALSEGAYVVQPSLAFAPDGELIIALRSGDQGDYWVERFDTDTLHPLAQQDRLALPRHCGGSRLWTSAEHVFVVCTALSRGGTAAEERPFGLYFIDTVRWELAYVVPIEMGNLSDRVYLAGVVVADAGTTAYVVLSNLEVRQDDLRTGTLLRRSTAHTVNERDYHLVAVHRVGDESLLVSWRRLEDDVMPQQLLRLGMPDLEQLPAPAVPLRSAVIAASGTDAYVSSVGTTTLGLLNLTTGAQRELQLGGTHPVLWDLVRAPSLPWLAAAQVAE